MSRVLRQQTCPLRRDAKAGGVVDRLHAEQPGKYQRVGSGSHAARVETLLPLEQSLGNCAQFLFSRFFAGETEAHRVQVANLSAEALPGFRVGGNRYAEDLSGDLPHVHAVLCALIYTSREFWINLRLARLRGLRLSLRTFLGLARVVERSLDWQSPANACAWAFRRLAPHSETHR